MTHERISLLAYHVFVIHLGLLPVKNDRLSAVL